jgi:hypothetical protein
VLRWREIAGADVARIAQPLRIRQGSSGAVLTLRADPAAAVFLQHESRALCARINTYLGRQTVERLRFVPGDVAAAPERRTQKNPQESLSDDPARKFVGDDRLKEAHVNDRPIERGARLCQNPREAMPGKRLSCRGSICLLG